MKTFLRFAAALPVLMMLAWPASAQKVKVGYDKSVDFSKFTSYSIAQPETPPARPLLYYSILGSIEQQLRSKGLIPKPSDGDLIVVPAGGMEFGLNVAAGLPILPSYSGPPVYSPTMWWGTGEVPNAMAPYVPQGTLVLTFVERSTNHVVWQGSVTEKFDMERKEEALRLADKAIIKLFKQFPPKKK